MKTAEPWWQSGPCISASLVFVGNFSVMNVDFVADSVTHAILAQFLCVQTMQALHVQDVKAAKNDSVISARMSS